VLFAVFIYSKKQSRLKELAALHHLGYIVIRPAGFFQSKLIRFPGDKRTSGFWIVFHPMCQLAEAGKKYKGRIANFKTLKLHQIFSLKKSGNDIRFF